jgi:hypothetical protein
MNQAEDRPERLASLQFGFAAHIRDPDSQPAPPDVEDRRMQIYRELFFNNIKQFLSSNFPVIRKLYADGAWNQLTRDFYSEHRCQTPLFPELAKEFLRYVQDQRGEHPDDPPFLLELAHYEWVELALSLDEHELDEVDAERPGDLLDGIPVLSPLAWPLSYRYPVHLIRPEYRPDSAPEQATHLLVWRNSIDEIKFMKLNDVSRLLLDYMQRDDGLSGRQILQEIAKTLGHPVPARVVESGARLLLDLQDKDIVPGSRPAGAGKPGVAKTPV